jgi:nucleotide-binding universal stress UspA family protein
MYSQIMVPLDGSEFAEQALPHAEYLAKTSGATLHLVRVVEPPAAVRMHGVGAPVNVYEEVIAAQRQEAIEYLDILRARVRSDGPTVQTAQLDGTATTVLLDYVQTVQIDLVVMTAHGRSGLMRSPLGPVADRVTREGTAAVLLVPTT